MVRNVGNNSNHHSQYHNHMMRGSIVSDILQDDHINNNINDSRLVLG